jgi:hypothetical protein
MLMLKLKRTELIWGLVGFTLGASLSGAAAGAIGYSRALVPSPNTEQEVHISQKGSALRIFLPPVKSDEIDDAIRTLPKKEQLKIRQDLADQKYQLLWLTIWDWDTAAGEEGNTVSVASDEFRRIMKLNSRRTRTVIPKPKSGYIEFRGEATEDGNINISVLSGTQPIALPSMPPGQTAKVEIWR